MARLYVEIITPERILFQDEIDMIEARGTLGEFGVLPGHIQFLTTLEEGEIRCVKDGKKISISAGKGFAEVLNDKVLLLLEKGEILEQG